MMAQSALLDDIKHKTCKGCKASKPYTRKYYEIGRNYCKECRSLQHKEMRKKRKSEDIVLYRCQQMAYDAYSRIYAPSRKHKSCYRDLDNPYEFENPQEMCDFLYGIFYNEIKSLLDKKTSPSVDRIDNTKGYSKNNIRIISHERNTELGVENRKRKVKMITPKDEVIIFESTVKCVEYFGYGGESSNRVSHWVRRCQGKKGAYRVPKGYHFEYII